MNIQKALGNAIRKVRISKGLSQEYFSDISSRTYLSVLENGKKNASVEKVEIIALAMNVHPLTILTLAYLDKDGNEKLESLQKKILQEIAAMS